MVHALAGFGKHFFGKNVMKGLARVLIGACVFSVGREDDPSRLRLGALFSR